MTPDQLINRLCFEWGHNRKDLISRNKSYPLTWHRQMAMVLCFKLLGSNGAVAELFGRSHSAVTYTMKVFKDRLSVDRKASAEWENIITKITL